MERRAATKRHGDAHAHLLAGNWSVTATADNSSGDGAVKTYPNVHRDYHNWNAGHERSSARSRRSIRSTFASRSPHVGIYDGAYDIWMNGVASPATRPR